MLSNSAVVSRLEALVKASWRSVACRYTARTAAGAFSSVVSGIVKGWTCAIDGWLSSCNIDGVG